LAKPPAFPGQGALETATEILFRTVHSREDTMNMKMLKVFVVCMFFPLCLCSYNQAHSQGWSDFTIRALPDSSFALVEFDKYGNKVRHFPYRDVNGHIDVDQLIYCLGTFGDETWVDLKNKEIAKKHLEEHYHRFKQRQVKEGMTELVNINKASLQEMVRLPNIGPVAAVRIYKYRETREPFHNVEEIKKVEGIGPSIFAGIRYYIKVR